MLLLLCKPPWQDHASYCYTDKVIGCVTGWACLLMLWTKMSHEDKISGWVPKTCVLCCCPHLYRQIQLSPVSTYDKSRRSCLEATLEGKGWSQTLSYRSIVILLMAKFRAGKICLCAQESFGICHRENFVLPHDTYFSPILIFSSIYCDCIICFSLIYLFL